MKILFKITFIFLLFFLFLAPVTSNPKPVFADFTCCPFDNGFIERPNGQCQLKDPPYTIIQGNICTQDQTCNTRTGQCQGSGSIESVFGRIIPPSPIQNLGSGTSGINNFLSKIIQLIYVAAGIIFVFMVLVSGVQWILSGGDKEAVGNAKKRLTWAIIGIVFLALAFVIIRVIGQITGFEFFAGQNDTFTEEKIKTGPWDPSTQPAPTLQPQATPPTGNEGKF